MGSNDNDIERIKKHRFFRKIDWKAIEARKVAPPIIPILVNTLPKYDLSIIAFGLIMIFVFQTDPENAENFDSKFTKELPIESPADASCPLDSSYKNHFQGFSYVSKHNHMDLFCT